LAGFASLHILANYNLPLNRALYGLPDNVQDMLKKIYIALCVAGLFLPYSQLAPWLFENGLSPLLLIEEILASRISSFAWLDVIVSAVVLLTFVNVESRRLGMRGVWKPWVVTLTVGVSLGLPLFLLMREYHLSAQRMRKVDDEAI